MFIYAPVWALPRIVVLGDSLAAGYGIDIQRSWIALLQKQVQSQYEVINAGISGDTTANGAARIAGLLQRYRPKIVIIELGGNDGLRGIPLPVIKANLIKIIEQTKHFTSRILLVGVRLPPNYGPAYTQQFQNMFLDVAKQQAVAVLPLLLAGVDDNAQLMQNDGIHPTAEAQPVIFNNIWRHLKPML